MKRKKHIKKNSKINNNKFELFASKVHHIFYCFSHVFLVYIHGFPFVEQTWNHFQIKENAFNWSFSSDRIDAFRPFLFYFVSVSRQAKTMERKKWFRFDSIWGIAMADIRSHTLNDWIFDFYGSINDHSPPILWIHNFTLLFEISFCFTVRKNFHTTHRFDWIIVWPHTKRTENLVTMTFRFWPKSKLQKSIIWVQNIQLNFGLCWFCLPLRCEKILDVSPADDKWLILQKQRISYFDSFQFLVT